MTPQEVRALALEHVTAEEEYDVDRIMATLVPEPVFAFFPLRKAFRGGAVTRRYYDEGYPAFAERIAGYEVLREWVNDEAFLQEYTIDVRDLASGSVQRFNIMSMMPVDVDAGLLAGETLYCDDELVRALIGPVYDELRPLG